MSSLGCGESSIPANRPHVAYFIVLRDIAVECEKRLVVPVFGLVEAVLGVYPSSLGGTGGGGSEAVR